MAETSGRLSSLYRKVYDICCGIGVHKKLAVACLRNGGKREIRQTGATARELLELADLLKSEGCRMAAMESAEPYWKPPHNMIGTGGLSAMAVNAKRMKAVPGRKTDASDAEWIADLAQRGLLRASGVPEKRGKAPPCSARRFRLAGIRRRK